MFRQVQHKISQKKLELDMAMWMNQSPNPLPILRPGQAVYVYRQSRWVAGTVVESSAGGCTVKLINSGQVVNIYDARCVRQD